jgi:trimeric autotransporter adhesin
LIKNKKRLYFLINFQYLFIIKNSKMKKLSLIVLLGFFSIVTISQTTTAIPWGAVTGNPGSIWTSYNGVFGGNQTSTFRLSLVGTANVGNRKMGINATQVLYLPDQAIFTNSFAVGNGLNNITNTAATDQGKYNTAVGIGTMNALTSGGYNTALGSFALGTTTTGTSNVAIGHSALNVNLIGSINTAVGINALYNNTGSNNVAIGGNALQLNTTGSGSTAIGYAAGFNATTANNIIAIGANTNLPSATNWNQMNIGNVIFGLGLTGSVSAPAGNIGIGTSAPGSTLDVKGAFRLSGATSGFVGFTPAAVAGSVTYTLPSSDGTAGQQLTTNASGLLSWSSANGATTNVLSVVGTNLTSNVNGISSSVLLSSLGYWIPINGTGNVTNNNAGAIVIGSISSIPTSGYKLYVAEGILTEKIKAALKNGANWSDFVFADDYKLKSLEEVEQFINTYKHLPGVPSAEELVKDGGIDMNKMFAKQMEKIEELTLYIIEMKKEIKALQTQNMQLKNAGKVTNK